jgi:hypothetical protein
MSNFYQVTANQGRTDTFIVEADTVTDIKTFYEAVSTANITSIKKIVYSKELGIGTALTSYVPNNQDKFLNIMVKNEKGVTDSLNISFPIKNLSSELITKNIKKYLTLDGHPIVEVLNILVGSEGLAPIGGQ